MILSRRWSLFLLAVTAWSWFIWPTFLKNIAADDRAFTDGVPQPFFLVHLVLVVVSLAIGTALGVLGVRGVRATRGNNNTSPVVLSGVDQESQG